MKYILPTKDTSYFPDTLSVLDALPDEILNHASYQLMHPFDIFSSVLQEVIESGITLSKLTLNRINNPLIDENEADNIEAQIRNGVFNFLFCLANYIDGCKSIIKCIYSKENANHTKISRQFEGIIKPYSNHLMKIVNHIKHRHRSIRILTGSWDNNIIVGYFIEGVINKETIGPDPEIHAYGKTAISLNRDIPFHICNIFFVATALKTTIEQNTELMKDLKHVKIENDKIFELLSITANLPKLYFPDEITKPVPDIKIIEKSVSISLPSTKKALNRHPHSMKLRLQSTLRKHSRTLSLPYIGESEVYS